MVMGMHRSGTSALTGVLGMMGVDLGKTMMKPTEENPRGYFENQRVNEINQRLLAALESSWDDIFPHRNEWWNTDAARPFAGEIKTIIKEEFSNSPLFAVKDPRICRLFQIWREVLDDMGIEIRAVIPVRHPAEVAESLRLRHGFSLEKGLLLWMIHTISAELLTRGIPRSWISFEGLLRHTEKIVSRICRALDLLLPKAYDDVRDEVGRFLDPSLKHFDHKKAVRSVVALPRLLGDWNRLLTAACRGDGTDRRTIKAMDDIREEFERTQGLFQPMEIRQGYVKTEQAGTTRGEGQLFSAPVQSPSILASESWQWLKEYREASGKFAPYSQPKRRKKDFKSGPATCHAKVIDTGNDLRHANPFPEKPRIVHVIGNLRTGGSTRLVVDLFERLGHIYDQEVISLDIPEPLHYDGFPFHDFSEPVTVEELSGFFREKAPHIIHFHYWLDPWYEKVMEAASGTGAVIIENVNTPFRILRHPAVRHYVFVSRHARDSAAPVPDDTSIIYPGSDGKRFSSPGMQPEDTIGMVYRLDKDKLREDSIQPLIKAVKIRPRTRAIIVGGGSLLPFFRRQVAEAEVAGRFLFTGYVPYDELPGWYRKFTVFAAPVWNESFGQVVPFAMAAGIPVAGYNVGALPEILGADGGQPAAGHIGAQPHPAIKGCLAGSERELVDIILRLLEDTDLRHAIGALLRERFNSLFRVEAMIERYDALYRRFLEGENSGLYKAEGSWSP